MSPHDSPPPANPDIKRELKKYLLALPARSFEFYDATSRGASKRMASRRVDAPREEDPEDNHHQGGQQHQHQHSDQDQLGLRVAKIHGPPQAEALRDKHRRIVGIVVKEACIPVPIIIAENGVGALTISGCARFCPGTLRMPEQYEDDGNQHSTHQQENGPGQVHRCSSFNARRG